MPRGLIPTVSPSLLNALLACPARVFFDIQHAGGGSPPATAASMMGSAVHRALDELVRTRQLWTAEPVAVRTIWLTALAEVGAGGEQDVVRLPSFYIKQARLVATASRLRELLPSSAEAETELPLVSSDGVIKGRVDLAARTTSGTWIIDYKSGIERDGSSGRALVEPYERQLRLYCYLWHEQFSDWPTRGILLPLDGPPIEIDVSPGQCVAIAEDARSRLIEFNEALPDSLPATPSPASCRFCRHGLVCDLFRQDLSVDWAADLLACIGHVKSVEASQGAGVSLLVGVTAGSTAESVVALTRIEPVAHPSVLGIEPGDQVAAIGLYRVGKDGAYGLRDSGVLTARSPVSASDLRVGADLT